MPSPPTHLQIFLTSLRLGLIAFGGPTAHLGYFHEDFVRRRKWLKDADYADTVALSQFLPGPASSQTIFAIGLRLGGWTGALLASAGFTLPSAVVMILFAYGINAVGNLENAHWLNGLKLAAVAVVAKALIEMARRLCPDMLRRSIAIAATALLIATPNPWLQIAAIITGSVVTWQFGKTQPTTESHHSSANHSTRVASACLLLFAILLVGLPAIAWINPEIAKFDSFYRSGALVFGGGHVVLPLLQAELIPPGWVTNDAFLAGYGAAQAIPGPLFTFAAYLGAVAQTGHHAWLGGIIALTAIFLPGWLLMAGSIPFWEKLRTKPSAQAMLQGANASVVGILAAALYHPVGTSSIHSLSDLVFAATAFALLQWAKCPPWLLVILAAAAAQWIIH